MIHTFDKRKTQFKIKKKIEIGLILKMFILNFKEVERIRIVRKSASFKFYEDVLTCTKKVKKLIFFFLLK